MNVLGVMPLISKPVGGEIIEQCAAAAGLANFAGASTAREARNQQPDRRCCYPMIRPSWMRLRPVSAGILQEEGVRDKIAALVLVESAGQPTALRPQGARGIWQFVPDTSRRFSLTINSETDDRRDVPKSRRAAARCLDQQFSRALLSSC